MEQLSPGNRDRGAALILTALALMLLVGVVGLALDGGQAYNTRRGTQNAADNAALAAAWAHCANLPDPIAHGIAVAETNGYLAADVTVTQMTPSSYDGEYRVVISSEEETGFARVLGVEQMTVVSEATAGCVRSTTGGPAAMFSKGPSCVLNKSGTADVTGFIYSAGDMLWNGHPSQELDADVHSDGNLEVMGGAANLNITGQATAHGTSNASPPVITGAPKLNLGWPIDFNISDFEPGSNAALEAGDQYHQHPVGNRTVNQIENLGPGIHFIQGNVTGNNLDGGPYTIIATGTISTNSPSFDAYYEGLAMMAGAFSPQNCGTSTGPPQIAIHLAGTSDIAGILFAPNGLLRVDGGAVNGGMIAWSIVTGGNLDLEVDASLFPTGDPRVFLLD